MKISRNFGCGPYTFDLTPEELDAAYKEKQHLDDVTIVRERLAQYKLNPDRFSEAFGVAYFDLSDRVDSIAYDMRRRLDKWNDTDDTAFYECIGAIECAVRCTADY